MFSSFRADAVPTGACVFGTNSHISNRTESYRNVDSESAPLLSATPQQAATATLVNVPLSESELIPTLSAQHVFDHKSASPAPKFTATRRQSLTTTEKKSNATADCCRTLSNLTSENQSDYVRSAMRKTTSTITPHASSKDINGELHHRESLTPILASQAMMDELEGGGVTLMGLTPRALFCAAAALGGVILVLEALIPGLLVATALRCRACIHVAV